MVQISSSVLQNNIVFNNNIIITWNNTSLLLALQKIITGYLKIVH